MQVYLKSWILTKDSILFSSCRLHSLRNPTSPTPDIKGLLGFGYPRNTACGCVNY